MQWLLKSIKSKQSDSFFWLVFELERDGGGIQYCVKVFEKGMNIQLINERIDALNNEIKSNKEI